MSDAAKAYGGNGRTGHHAFSCPVFEDVREIGEKVEALDRCTTNISTKLEDTVTRLAGLVALFGDHLARMQDLQRPSRRSPKLGAKRKQRR